MVGFRGIGNASINSGPANNAETGLVIGYFFNFFP